VRLLRAGEDLPFAVDDAGQLSITIPQLGHYEVILFEYEKSAPQPNTLGEVRSSSPTR
jgi:hypothetical protein